MAIHSLSVTTRAADITLLSAAERRAAVGLAPTDNSKDLELASLDARVAAMISSECNIAAPDDGSCVPTLRKERLLQSVSSACQERSVLLRRRHNIQIVSVGGTDFDATSMFVNSGGGILSYRNSGYFSGDFDIDYWAGFETVPDDLKQAAIEAMRIFYMEGQRDPSVKSRSVETTDIEVVKTDYWVGLLPGQTAASGLPTSVIGLLKRFRNVAIA